MRTTLDIDEKVLKQIEEITGEKSKSKAVDMALREYIRRQKVERLISLFGTLEMVEDWRVLRDGELGPEQG